MKYVRIKSLHFFSHVRLSIVILIRTCIISLEWNRNM